MNIIKKGEENESRWARGLATRPILQNLASTKYNLGKKPPSQVLNFTYDPIAKFGDVMVYKNKYFVPLGFMYDTYIPLGSFKMASAIAKEQIIQGAFIAEEPINPGFKSFKLYDLNDTLSAFTFDRFYSAVAKQKEDTLAVTMWGENRIEGTISPKTKKLLFFSIPFDKGWHARIDGKATAPLLCNIGFMGFILEPGKHHVELFYRPPLFYESLFVTVIALLIYLLVIAADHFHFKRNQKRVDV